MKEIVVGITGASGSIYAKHLLDLLDKSDSVKNVHLVMSETAEQVWMHEIGEDISVLISEKIIRYDSNDFNASFASGSSVKDAMIIIPCTMGTMAKVSHGIADSLITRAADVFLKEGRKLIIVPRETPFNLIHIKNMEQLFLSGAKIVPACPSFYSKPQTIDEMVRHFVSRILDQIEIPNNSYRW